MSNISKKVFVSLLPPGPLWVVKPSGGLDQLLDGIALNSEAVNDFLDCLSCLRDPFTTPFLSDLEREYGSITSDNISEDVRRQRLAAEKVYPVVRTGSDDDLENALQKAGFDVQVHVNSPAVDPAIILQKDFQMVAGGGAAYAGNQDAFAGVGGGDLLVNGEIITQTPAYGMQAAGQNAFAGNQKAVAGFFDSFNRVILEYPIPTDPDSWPFIFFVGGDATRNGSGEITDIETANVPLERKKEFLSLILSIKGLHSWGALIINYV